ncbi:helix-turn-helix domain-containing protein [Seminibacterium arietis]|uniref:Helix-turn-helix domain-containing protein n=1 Tax=Seminibacterium arietis TaxID=1173502 RepID=A0ABW3I9E1_9PAST
MGENTVSKRLKYLRSINKKTQKEFAEFLGIPQPSMSAYENGKNNPTIDVLIDIADKCKVSLDWLAGRSDYTFGLSSMGDFVLFIYELSMKKEIGFEIIVENKFPNDIETDENKWNAKLVFYGNDKDHPFNADVCNILKELSDNLFDLESYSITKEQFDSMKNKSVEYYSLPLTQKEFEELSRDEILKKRIGYLKENNLL